MTPQRRLQIVKIMDGRPGHEKQTEGVIKALGRSFQTVIHAIKVDPGKKAVMTAVKIMAGDSAGLPDQLRPDLIIGTGSHTHLAALAIKKKRGGHAVTCMTPGWLVRRFFDLCLVPRHDGLSGSGNIFITDGPPGPNINEGNHRQDHGLILVGGEDPKSHTWDDEDMATRVRGVVTAHPNINWSLTTSPRTPLQFLTRLAGVMADAPISVFPFGETEAGWLESALKQNQFVAVTEDSVSMIFEALSAGCTVSTIPVDFIRDNKFVNNLKSLKDRGLLVDDFKGSHHQVCGLDEAGRCAKEMEARWWPNN